MSDGDALLAAIRDDPTDDLSRLVLADWYDDYGDPSRAEFIRLQCKHDTLPQHSPQRFDAWDRAQELLADNRTRWLPALPGDPGDVCVEFRRGLPEVAWMTAATWMRHGEQLAQLLPLRQVALRGIEAIDRVAALVSATGVSELTCYPPSVSSAWVAQLFASLTSPRLRSLALLRDANLREVPDALLAWPGLGRLTALILHGSGGLDRFRQLFGSPSLGQLTTLIGRNLHSSMADLVANERLFGLRRLEVHSDSLSEISPLLASAPWSKLERLVLFGSQQGAEGLRSLFRASWVPGLHSLSLTLGDVSPESVALADARFERLSSIRLSGPRATEWAKAVAVADFASGLTSLELSQTSLGDTVAALATSARFGQLTHLGLSCYGASLAPLLNSSRLPALRALSLTDRLLRSQAEQLADCPGLARIRYLSVGAMSRDAIEVLANSPHASGLIRLLVSGGVDTEGVEMLTKASWIDSLRELKLDNDIGDLGAVALAQCAGLSRLRGLELRSNRIGDFGAKALADSPYLGRLSRLVLTRRNMQSAVQDRLRERFGTALVLV